jgi:geranylgeranyl reductase
LKVEALEDFDAIVVGGGPAGATAAHDLARQGKRVMLLDKAGRIKPCGGAIPPQLMREFDIPEHLLCARAGSARIVSPTHRNVEMPIAKGGFVGMVNRDSFDEWLRERAAQSGAVRRTGSYEGLERDRHGRPVVRYETRDTSGARSTRHAVARVVIGADGAASRIAREEVPGNKDSRCVYAYHEILRAPRGTGDGGYDPSRCDVHYRGTISPDFYGWIFPHGETLSVGTGSALRGFSLRRAVSRLREETGLAGLETLRREGAPIPMRPLARWDNGRDVVLAGDAAGVVAPASGEGIYYAMAGGRMAAEAAVEFLVRGDGRALAGARKRFMRAHGRVFWVLGMMQRFWYSSDRRRERFVTMCGDTDVQTLTWEAYLNKRLVRARPMAHARVFFKDMAHLLGIVSP